MQLKEVYIVDGRRTPHAKAGGELKDVPAPFLGAYLIRKMMDIYQLQNDCIDEVIIGNTGSPAKYPNIGRVVALEAGLHKQTSAYSVHRNCASGMEALSQAYIKIAANRSDMIFAGGVESMSQMPLIYSKEMTDLFAELMKSKTIPDKLKAISKFRPPFLSPIIAIVQGLTDPFCGLNMGQTAELLSRELSITRQQQDEWALLSHQRACLAIQEGKFDDEILPLAIGTKLNKLLSKDMGPRPDSSMEKLAKMKPYFDRKSGTVTAANSCPLTDGGSALLICSKEALKKYNMEPMARIVDYHFHGLDPERMGMGPLHAMDGVFKRSKLSLSDMDLVEVNEAFAAQILAVKKGFTEKKVADFYGIDTLWGELPDEKLNVNGGAIAFGHPVGSTGARLVITLANELKKRKARYGVASLCIGGGQGGACIIENLVK